MNETNTTQSTETEMPKSENLMETMKGKVGELLEQAGEMVAQAGAPELGQKIHDLGDSLETEHSKPSHPEEVASN